MLEPIGQGAAMAEGDRDRLIVFCSSRTAYRMDMFDFADRSDHLSCQRLFLRALPTECFYHDGLPGLTRDMEENVAFLLRTITHIAPKRLTFVGNSSGGYAAIVLGHMLGADDIHVVSPVTYLDARLGDDPANSELWENVFDPVGQHFADTGKDRRYLSCRAVIAKHPDTVKVLRQYVVSTNAVDLNHADHIAGFPHVQTVVYPRGRHANLAALLLRDGSLFGGVGAGLAALQSAPVPPFRYADHAP